MTEIIILEDSKSAAAEYYDALRNNDYSVFIANDSTMAMGAVRKRLPSLFICDNKFAGQDDEYFKRLIESLYSMNIPVIYVLGDQKAKIDKSVAATKYFLQKPFTSTELQRLVMVALSKYEEHIKSSTQRINELRGSISFSLPHEFFTPLNGILGFTDILLKEYDTLPKSEALEMLKYVSDNAFRLKKLTDNFLTYTELELMLKNPELMRNSRRSYYFNPKEIIRSAAELIAIEYSRSDDLILELDDCPIRMSEEYVKKLVTEIIDNAFKFSESGSQVHVLLMSNDTSVMIIISDNGSGMKPDQLSSIGAYMQFNRQKRDQQGSGLGLAICKKICELHGGEFEIESIENEGTKVKMVFDN